MGKKKVAVLLFGILRYWEECSTIFSYWNQIYDDIEFDFYLATWRSTHTYLPEKGKIDSPDANKSLYLKDIQFYEESTVRAKVEGPLRDYFFNSKDTDVTTKQVPLYSFLKSSVCNQAINSGVKYDAAIITRPDVFVFIETLEVIRKSLGLTTVYSKPKHIELGHNIIYNSDYPQYRDGNLFLNRDTLWFGSPEVVFEYRHLFNDAFVDYKLPAYRLHTLQPEFLLRRMIYSASAGVPTNVLVRAEKFSKGFLPTPAVLTNLINTYGKDLYRVDSKHLTTTLFRERNV